MSLDPSPSVESDLFLQHHQQQQQQQLQNTSISKHKHRSNIHSHGRSHSHDHSSSFPCLQQLLLEPLLLNRRKTREIFLVSFEKKSKSLQSQKIANFNTFLAMNFSLKQVSHNVPLEVAKVIYVLIFHDWLFECFPGDANVSYRPWPRLQLLIKEDQFDSSCYNRCLRCWSFWKINALNTVCFSKVVYFW